MPAAHLLVAKSTTSGGSPLRGMPTQNGFVPTRARTPPNGATIGSLTTLTKCTEARPAAAHCSAQWPMRPRWWLLRKPSRQQPSRAARGMARARASCALSLAGSLARVADQDRTGIENDLDRAVEGEFAGEGIADIGGNHADAMRVVPAQIGLDELIGDQRRIALGRAGGAEDRVDEPPRDAS